jgi:cytoskeletal protein CcmA (bactofilin family)
MWRKQEEPKATSPATQVSASPVVASKADSPAPVASAPAATVSPAVSPAPPVAPAAQSRPSSPSAGHVSSTLVIKGEITGREDLFIDGDVQGKIRIDEGKVTVGSHGRVTADIVARQILVQGNVKGNLHGRERVQIGQTGRAHGNVITRRISIDDGAEMHGNVEITPAEASAQLSRTPSAKSLAAEPPATQQSAARTQEPTVA